jgi:putative membrane protein
MAALRIPSCRDGLAVPTAVVLLLAGCGGPGADVDGQPAPRAVLSDANITSILTSANNAEIGEAQLALTRSTDRAVRDFAQRMINDHSEANQRIMQVAARTGMQPDATTDQIQDSAQRARQALQVRTGADFDQAYIANQINMHRWLLETIDQALLPAARDGRLEDLIASLRPTIVEHLQHAQRIQQSLEGR